MTKETVNDKFVKFLCSYILVVPGLAWLAVFYRIYDGFKYEWFQDSRRISTPDAHARRVARIQGQVRAWAAGGRKSRMCTARKVWNTWNVHGLSKNDLAQIHVENLKHIVKIDEARRELTVEPGLMMGQLTSLLIPKGWTIPVVPEFETLTVGGVICGTGIESSSGRHGLSSDFCLEYELVLSNGDLITCSKDKNSDLFYSVPWSHGTLGFLTAIKIPLIPARKYVKLQYHPVDSFDETQRLLDGTSEYHDFVEGIAFGRNQFVVMHGDLTSKSDSSIGPVNHINRWYKPWFFKHVESFLRRRRFVYIGAAGKQGTAKYVEYIPLRDYYHRHTRSYFWETPIILPYGNNWLLRWVFGYIYPVNYPLFRRFGSKAVYDKFYVLNHVLQDFIVPMKHLKPALDLVHETVEVYPLWLCPCKFFNKPGMAHVPSGAGKDESATELYIDIGIYGTTPKKDEYDSEKTIRRFEAFALENNGVQFLYADSFLSREEFRRMFDMELYDKVRAKYDCLDAFPDVYDKVSRHARRIEVPESKSGEIFIKT